MDPSIFKAYDIRGLYGEQLDEQAAWKIGHAAAQFLRASGGGAEVIITRPEDILSAVAGESGTRITLS